MVTGKSLDEITGSDPVVSVIIPVLDAAKHLRLSLESLEVQTGVSFEVLVVDDGSSDCSPQIAREFHHEVFHTSGNEGPYVARNLGAKQARGSILLFLDSDVRLHPDLLTRAVRCLESDQDIAAVFGAYDDSPEYQGFISQYRNLLHAYVHHLANRQATTFWTGFGLIRRTVFNSAGGFSVDRKNLRDIELGIRLTQAGHRIILDNTLRVQHLKRWTLRSMFRTDVLLRAANWTELILRYRKLPNDLNVRRSERYAVMLATLSAALLVVALYSRSSFATAAFLLVTAAYVFVVWNFLAYLSAIRGRLFAAGSVLLHIVYHWSCAVGLFIGAVRFYGVRRRLIEAGMLVSFAVFLFDVTSGLEHWPISNYAMYSGIASSRLVWLRLYGVTPQGEIPLNESAYLEPYDEVRMNAALESLLVHNPAAAKDAIGSQLILYERNRVAGRHRGPRLSSIRLYRVIWDLRNGKDDAPLSRTLLAQAERPPF